MIDNSPSLSISASRDATDSSPTIHELFDRRLGHDPGTLNFVFPYSRFMRAERPGSLVVDGWNRTLASPTTCVIYAHVPFCPQHCSFCGFATTYAAKRDRVDHYLRALEVECDLLREALPLDRLDVRAVFIGGGTPNYLTAPEFGALVETLRRMVAWDLDVEWSVEIYPSSDLTGPVLEQMRASGVNRISFAAQDFNDDVLQRASRSYSAAEALAVAKRIQELGFAGMNVDLMVGIPGQSLANVAANLEALDRLAPTHVTLNPFSNRSPRIPLRARRFRDELHTVDSIRQLYEHYRSALLARGFRQVGKTNFELAGARPFLYEALVRSSTPRLGVGMNSLSFNGEATYRNADTVSGYTTASESRRLPVAAAYHLSPDDAARARAFYGILSGRLDLAVVQNGAGRQPDFLHRIAEILLERGLATLDGGALVLTDEGLWNVGIVQRAFLPVHVLESIVGIDSAESEVRT